MSVTLSNDHGTSNGTSDVTIVAAPGATIVKRVTKTITFHNTNATARTVTLKMDDGTNERIIAKNTLAQDKSWIFTAPLILTYTSASVAEKLEMVLDAGTTDVQWTTHYAEVS